MSWEMAAFSAVAPMQLDEPLALMVFSGALERHPEMRLVLAECGIGWVPYFVARMDQAGAKHLPKATDYQLKAKPSEIFRRQVYATFEEEPFGPQLIPILGPYLTWHAHYGFGRIVAVDPHTAPSPTDPGRSAMSSCA